MNRIAIVAGLAVGLAAGLAGTASAQQTQGAGRTDGASGESLSSKLSKSDGVIKPTGDVDPQMHKAAPVPEPNSTPVIPPAANSGAK